MALPRSETWMRWYRKNREEHNAKRRARYKKNASVRAKAKKASQKYREKLKEGYRRENIKYRLYKGRRIRVFTTSDLMEILGVTRQTILNWEKYGWLPSPIFEGSHRLYTQYQVGLLRRFHRALIRERAKGYRDIAVRIIPDVERLWDDWRKD